MTPPLTKSFKLEATGDQMIDVTSNQRNIRFSCYATNQKEEQDVRNQLFPAHSSKVSTD